MNKDYQNVPERTKSIKESEDERIRKGLLEIFNKAQFGEWGKLRIKDIIAYLEKQKDASKAIETVERIDKYIDEHLANAHDMKDSNPDKKYYRGWDDALGEMARILQDVYSDEKQKEQKHEDWPNLSNCIKDCKKCQGKCFYRKEMYQEQENVSADNDDKLYVEDILSLLNFGCSTHSRNEIDIWIKSLPERLNHKPVKLSEEDENCRHDILLTLEALCSSASSTDTYIVYKHLIDWLKSFPERFNLQPKQEWSEEDERHKEAIIECIRLVMMECADSESIEKYENDINWLNNRLKSLRSYRFTPIQKTAISRAMFLASEANEDGLVEELKKIYDNTECVEPIPHWKPSEEQMRAVFDASERNDKLGSVLRNLYNDLKKLM